MEIISIKSNFCLHLEYLKFARRKTGMQVYEKAVVMKVIFFIPQIF